MIYKLVISERADVQIDRLAAYLVFTLKNPSAAGHFLDELKAIYALLQENPFQFRQCNEAFLADSGYRNAILSSMRYRVVFRVERDIVYIVGVFHTLENYTDKITE